MILDLAKAPKELTLTLILHKGKHLDKHIKINIDEVHDLKTH